MAYDEALAQRLRQELAGRAEVTEKKMFGGLAFLVRGNMCVGVTGTDLIARVDPARHAELLARPGASPFAVGGRAMAGWLVVDRTEVADPQALAAWIEEADAFVRALPSKG